MTLPSRETTIISLLIALIIGGVAAIGIRRHVLYGDALCTTCIPVEVDYWHPKVDASPVIAP